MEVTELKKLVKLAFRRKKDSFWRRKFKKMPISGVYDLIGKDIEYRNTKYKVVSIEILEDDVILQLKHNATEKHVSITKI